MIAIWLGSPAPNRPLPRCDPLQALPTLSPPNQRSTKSAARVDDAEPLAATVATVEAAITVFGERQSLAIYANTDPRRNVVILEGREEPGAQDGLGPITRRRYEVSLKEVPKW
jgi:hypothetical protein